MTECELCAPGRYQSETGQASCDTVPAGSYANGTAANPPSQYSQCHVSGGWHSKSGSSRCGICISGYIFIPGRSSYDDDSVAEGAIARGGACVQCTGEYSGFDCTYDGVHLHEARLKPRFWRTEVDSDTIYRCPHSAACIGGAIASNFSGCAAGYTGYLCGVCDHSYYQSVEGVSFFFSQHNPRPQLCTPIYSRSLLPSLQ